MTVSSRSRDAFSMVSGRFHAPISRWRAVLAVSRSDAARRSVAGDLRTGTDSPYYLADFYLRETVQGTDASPDDIAALAETVTAEDVAAIARGVELDAVYFLRGEEAEVE